MEAAADRRTAHARPRRAPRPARGQPLARASSPQLLGMLLFIISEVMVFGAFFTAYFFIRVVQRRPVARPRAPSCRSRSPASTRRSCVSSSFTMHWAETAIKRATASA